MNKAEMDALQKIIEDGRDKQAPAPKYPIYKRLPPANPELHNAIEEIQREVSTRCYFFRTLGIEPFLEFTYGDEGQVKNVVVRPRRDDDPQVGNASFPIK